MRTPKGWEEDGMANKQSFTASEWTMILESAAVTGMAVTAADPSGIWGMLREAFAGGSMIAAIKADPNANPLVKAVIADLETKEARSAVQEALKKLFAGAKPADVVPRSLDLLRQVSAILDAKAPADAPAFKAFLNAVAQRVAEAAKEGSFLGFGGVKVSDAERATLAQIATALGTTAQA
jgi:hypothetical protein